MPIGVLQKGSQAEAAIDLATVYTKANELYARLNELQQTQTRLLGQESRAAAASTIASGEEDFNFYNAQGGSQIGAGAMGVGGTAANIYYQNKGVEAAKPHNEAADNAKKYEDYASQGLANGVVNAPAVASEGTDQTPEAKTQMEANARSRKAIARNLVGRKFEDVDLDRTQEKPDLEELLTSAKSARKDSQRLAKNVQEAYAQTGAHWNAIVGQALGQFATGGGSVASAHARLAAAIENAHAKLFEGTAQQADGASRAAESNSQAALELVKAVNAAQAAIAQAQRG